MANKKKKKDDGRGGWSYPRIVTPKKKPTTRQSKPAPKRPPAKNATATQRGNMVRGFEEQRRGMAETRRKAQAKRPTLSQKRAIQQRDKEMRQDAMLRSPAARRARDRMRAQF